ncbi:hypothetical protein AS594_13125 [Streptomyces agglomeratus]|uniref:Uncharacterized protein n=1 Tax=Streptomyces agglomeratus TaxID=285458 RepID=A0A1E5P7C9_9ACTN|nr:hypothetical protein [Streptomyces agglomeratus]OEJ25294.1 hypothetical protein AS594_13125 [Streptomyces agglomeratus]OEJ53217.1 hypothetical protein BGK72_22975 [Streptomyces agglomeratus]
MSRTTAYRVLGPTWGVAVDLTADSEVVAAPPHAGDRVGARTWLDVAPVLDHPPADRTGLRLTPAEGGRLRQGAGLAAGAVEAVLPPGRHVVLTVHRVLFPEADFRAEGLIGAMLTWCEEEFGIDLPGGAVVFDRDADRFVHAWEEPGPVRDLARVRVVRPARDLLGHPLPVRARRGRAQGDATGRQQP